MTPIRKRPSAFSLLSPSVKAPVAARATATVGVREGIPTGERQCIKARYGLQGVVSKEFSGTRAGGRNDLFINKLKTDVYSLEKSSLLRENSVFETKQKAVILL